MEKNVTDKLIEIRKSKGFKTRDMLMRSIEKFCKENNEKSFTDKTLQRMEKQQVASEKTISIVAAVLNIEPNNLRIGSKVNYTKVITDEAYSEIILIRLDTIKNKYFQNNFSKTEKRKFIMDIADCDDHNQKKIIKEFIKLIDGYSEKKTDILKKIDADNFGSLEEVNSNISLEDELESILNSLGGGIQFYYPEYSNQYYPQPEWERIKPIYIYYGMHPYATYWPVPTPFYKTKLNDSISGGFSKHFPNKKFSDPSGYTYYPDKINDFVLAPLSNLYSFFVISTHPNLNKITYNNQVSKVIVKDWSAVANTLQQNNLDKDIDFNRDENIFKNIETKILGKKFKGLFDNIIKDIYHGVDGLPKNYLDESDFNIIYGADKTKDKIPADPDDFLTWFDEKAFKCYFKILSDAKFYNYVKSTSMEKYLNVEDNISYLTRDKWMKERKLYSALNEDIKQLLGHYDFKIDDVTKIILEGGKKLEEALEKSRPLTEEDIN